MELMGDMARSEQLVQGGRARIEGVLIFRATIEIDLQSGKIRRVCDRQRIVLIPVRGIEWRAKGIAEKSQPA